MARLINSNLFRGFMSGWCCLYAIKKVGRFLMEANSKMNIFKDKDELEKGDVIQEVEESKVSKDVAITEFERILKAARVKWWKLEKTSGKADTEALKIEIVDAIMDGRITVNDQGFPTIHTDNESEKLQNISILCRPIRAHRLAADRINSDFEEKAKDTIIADYLSVGNTKYSASELSLLEEGDYNILDWLWSLFLA